MARRVSDRIRLLRLELVETDPLVLELQQTVFTKHSEEQITVDTTRLIPAGAQPRDDDGILLQWLLEIILAESSPWNDEDPYADLVSEGRPVVWH